MQPWNTFTIEEKRWARWRIGPLLLYAQPRRREWIFAWEYGADSAAEALAFDMEPDQLPDSEQCTFARFAGSEMPNRLTVAPRLADRAFIVRPDSPLSVPAGEETVLFVRTVVWVAATVEVESIGNGHRTLLDIPAHMPSDSWFGPNTMEGELCYASRTRARTELEAADRQSYRSITPIEIANLGGDTLAIAQLRVPVFALSLHADRDGQLWTDAVRFIRNEDEREAELRIPESSIHLPADCTLLSKPRRRIDAGTIVDAFSRLLG